MSVFDIIEDASNGVEKKEESTTQTKTWGSEDKVHVAKDLDVESLKRGNKRFLCCSTEDLTDEVKENIKMIAMKLAEKGFVMRAEASDRNPLEQAIFATYAFKEIFLPSAGINKMVTPILKTPSDTAYSYAIWLYIKSLKDKTTEKFNAMSWLAKAFRARTIHMYLGEKLNEPIDFAIIYTKCGTTRFTKDTNFDGLGWEASRVIRDAKHINFKVYNIGSPESVNELLEAIETF